MYMVEKLDAGDMLAKVEVDIEETDNVGTLHDKLSKAGAKLISETVPKRHCRFGNPRKNRMNRKRHTRLTLNESRS